MNKEKEIRKIKDCISELVYDKVQLRKAYNYYHCNRDAEQFKHIEMNYGIGTPTSVGFTPLIKKHIDVLVGEYLELDPDLQISCKDEKTVSEIFRDKQLQIDSAAYQFFKQKLESSLLKVFQEGQETPNDPYYNKEVERIKKDIEKSYVSEYEKAGQNILNFIKNSRDIDIKNKMREILTDLLIGGVCYYRTKPSNGKNNLQLEVLNPLDTFIERNHNAFYLNRSPRAVIRKWMTKDQIFAEYNDELTPEAKKKLREDDQHGVENTGAVYVSVKTSMAPFPANSPTPGLLGGLEVTPLRDTNGEYHPLNSNLIEVYEVEWLEYDEDQDRLTRHEGVKIGEEIFIARGESENVIRSISNPKECTLSVNGLFFSDKNGVPFSIVLNTMDLQDWL